MNMTIEQRVYQVVANAFNLRLGYIHREMSLNSANTAIRTRLYVELKKEFGTHAIPDNLNFRTVNEIVVYLELLFLRPVSSG